MVFVVQLDNTKDTLEILLDDKGLALLRNIINKNWHEPKMRKDELYDLDHEHLLSKEWGGGELTPEYTSEGVSKINSVKIVYIGEQGESIIS